MSGGQRGESSVFALMGAFLGGVAIGRRTMMRMWCWRCETDVVMLDEPEAAIVDAALHRVWSGIKTARTATGERLDGSAITERFQPALDAYEALTGIRESDHVSLRHRYVAM